MTTNTRRLPLFPLNTVLFPGVSLPLQIFEERYKLMLRECMESGCPESVVAGGVRGVAAGDFPQVIVDAMEIVGKLAELVCVAAREGGVTMEEAHVTETDGSL